MSVAMDRNKFLSFFDAVKKRLFQSENSHESVNQMAETDINWTWDSRFDDLSSLTFESLDEFSDSNADLSLMGLLEKLRILDPEAYENFSYNSSLPEKPGARRKKHKKRRKNRIEKHSITSALRAAKQEFSRKNENDDLFYTKVENLIVFLYALSLRPTTESASCTAFLYFKTLYGKSVIQKMPVLWDSLQKSFSDLVPESSASVGSQPIVRSVTGKYYMGSPHSVPPTISYQGLPEDASTSSNSAEIPKPTVESVKDSSFVSETSKPKWLCNLTDAIKNFGQVRNSEFTLRLGNFVSGLIAMNFLDMPEDEVYKFKGYHLFKVEAWDIQKNALDFFEMVSSTLVFFIERGYMAFVSGDLSALKYNNLEIQNMTKEYTTYVNCMPLLEAGLLSQIPNDLHLKDAAEFEMKVDALMRKYTEMHSLEKSAYVKASLQNCMVRLSKVQAQIIICQKDSTLRVKPFSVLIIGKSSVGKSHINSVVVKSTLHANNFASESKNHVVMNAADKYQSEYKTHHTAVTIDDFGNTLSDKVDGCPTQMLIDLMNNIPKAALKADLESKGNVMLIPKVVTVTTNVADLHAAEYSAEPASVLRRFEVVLNVRLRPEFVDPCTQGLDSKKMLSTMVDAWLIDVCYVRITRRREDEADGYEYVPFEKDGFTYRGVSLATAVHFITEYSKTHFISQDRFVGNAEDLFRADMCEHSMVASECPMCNNCVESLHSKDSSPILAAFAKKKAEKETTVYAKSKTHLPLRMWLPTRMVGWATLSPKEQDFLVEHWEKKKAIPEQPPVVLEICKNALQRSNKQIDKHSSFVPIIGALGFLFILWNYFKLLSRHYYREIQMFILDWLRREAPYIISDLATDVAITLRNRTLVSIKGHTEDLYEVWKEKMEKHRVIAMKALGITVASLSVVYLASKMRQMVSAHSTAIPGEQPAPVEADKKNVWLKAQYTGTVREGKCENITSSLLVNLVEKNLFYATLQGNIKGEPQATHFNAFPISRGDWLVPHHAINSFDNECVFHVSNTRDTDLGRHHTQNISRYSWTRIGETDFARVRVLWSPNADFTDYFPSSAVDVNDLCCTFVHRKADKSLETVPIMVRGKKTHEDVVGFDYYHPGILKPGYCCSVLVANRKRPFFAGFHLAGHTGKQYGIAGELTKQQLAMAEAILDTRKDLIAPHSASDIPTSIYGMKLDVKQDMGKRHAARWLQPDDGCPPSLEVFGKVGEPVRFDTQVRLSPISESVEEHMEMPVCHKAPRTTGLWRHWNRDLNYVSKAVDFFRDKIMFLALRDLKRKVLKKCSTCPHFKTMVMILDDVSNISGVDMVTSVDRVNISTSAGFPLNKPKKHFVGPLDEIVEGISDPIAADPMIVERMEEMEQAFLSGKRINTVFRSCLKDEAIALEKDKIRIMAACEFAFTLITRKYFLTLVRYIQTHWLDFESAVGVNSHSREWDQLKEYVSQFGDDRVVAGDFKAFDKTMSGAMVMRSFSVLIYMAELAGYPPDAITVMWGIATEIAYPLYEFDGVLLQAFGSNPSGHPLTVIINGLTNSLYMRYAYYALHEEDLDKNDVRLREWLQHVNGELNLDPGAFSGLPDLVDKLEESDEEDDDDEVAPLLRSSRASPDDEDDDDDDNVDNVDELIAEPSVPDFDAVVALITYGDDNAMSVSEDEHALNHTTISEILDNCGIVYTMADKVSASRPFISLEETDFLKRGFRYEPELGCVVAPLAEKSLAKSLHFVMNRKHSDVLPLQVAAQALAAANTEFFYHGKEKFEERRSQMLKIIRDTDVKKYISDLPTWSQCISKFNGEFPHAEEEGIVELH
jgi:hypothetical protein